MHVSIRCADPEGHGPTQFAQNFGNSQNFRAACIQCLSSGAQSAACLWQQCCSTAQETRPASKPTPVDTTAYDRMNRHGSLSTVYFFTRPPHLRSLGARAHASHRLGDLRHWGRQARTRGPHLRLLPGPVRGRPATLAVPSSPNNIAVVGAAPGRRAPAANQSRTSNGHAAKAACARGLLLRPLLCDPT